MSERDRVCWWCVGVLFVIGLSALGCDSGGSLGGASGGAKKFHVGAGERWFSPDSRGGLHPLKSYRDLKPWRRHIAVVMLPGASAPKDSYFVVNAAGLKAGDEAMARVMHKGSFLRMVQQAPDPASLASHVRTTAVEQAKTTSINLYRRGARRARRGTYGKRQARSSTALLARGHRSKKRRGGKVDLTGRAPAPGPRTSGLADAALRATNARRGAAQRCGNRGARPPAPPLVLDGTLSALAKDHAKDLATRRQLSHKGSDGSSLTQRLRRNGVKTATSAENLARGERTASQAVKAWMRSERDCAHIMNPAFNRVGIGHARDDRGVRYWVQLLAQ